VKHVIGATFTLHWQTINFLLFRTEFGGN